MARLPTPLNALMLLFFCLPLIVSAAFVVNSNTTVGYGASPSPLVVPYNSTGTNYFTFVPFNVPYNASWSNFWAHETSRWNFTISVSAPDAWTNQSVLTTELTPWWPTGQGPEVKSSNWTVCVVYLPDILKFGDGTSLSSCVSAIDLLFRPSSSSWECGRVKSFVVPKVCKYSYQNGGYNEISGNFTMVSVNSANMTSGKPMVYQTDTGNPMFKDAIESQWPLLLYEYSTYTYGRNNIYNATELAIMTALKLSAYRTQEQYEVEENNPVYVMIDGANNVASSRRGAASRLSLSTIGVWVTLFGMALLL